MLRSAIVKNRFFRKMRDECVFSQKITLSAFSQNDLTKAFSKVLRGSIEILFSFAGRVFSAGTFSGIHLKLRPATA